MAAAAKMSERVGYAVLEKGKPLQPWRFQVPAEPGDQEIDIRVTVRAALRRARLMLSFMRSCSSV